MTELSIKVKEYYCSLSSSKKSVIWFTIATIIQNGIQFLVTPIFTRLLTDAEYGIYSIFQSWQQIFAIISVVALDRCITVGFMKFSNSKKQFYLNTNFNDNSSLLLFNYCSHIFKFF